MNETIYALEFDLNHDVDFSKWLDLLASYELRMTVLLPHGPAGGNPYVRVFSTNRAAVVKFQIDQSIYDGSAIQALHITQEAVSGD